MATIEIDVKKDSCLGYMVFRGSIKTREISPALWIDFHDEELNPFGYQRPFNSDRSLKAAEYAINESKAFWPESILAIRNDNDINDIDKVTWNFRPYESNGKYGKLVVEYNENRTEPIGNIPVPWRRAFSQVDCQHRLGHMSQYDKFVTVCIIPDITRAEEALIFKTINDKQKKISTSLVDAIILLTTTDPVQEPEIHWAYNLGIDYGSSFFKLVSSEGTNLKGQKYMVTLRTLKTCMSILLGGKRFIRQFIKTKDDYDRFYILIRNYWNVIKSLWPNEWPDKDNYKLMTVPGLKGLSKYGRKILSESLDAGDTSIAYLQKYFRKGPSAINWSSTIGEPLHEASGNTGIGIVYRELCKQYGEL
jgi:DGQHR domain-containing protein